MARRALLPALAVAAAAFALYHATLLPGVDFGDTGSFQAMAGSALITPRDGYPFYFALGNAVLWLTHADPAHALNLASALEGAAACALIVLAAAELSGSLAAAAAAALLFAVSYTFWSQAVIAEVYALHSAFLALSLLLILRWENQPTTGRLAAFFAIYALGFGNHLSMILLAPGFTIFLLMSAPGGWRSMLAPRIVGLAAACAAIGALQYVWNIRTLWLLPNPPHGVLDALVRFWFDVTKSDWRDTMMMNVPRSLLSDHAAMYWFDLREQFGVIGPLLAIAGIAQLAFVSLRRAMLVLALYAVNVVFAYSYNVGDTHVFYLPSHLIVAILAAPALAFARRFGRSGTPIAATLLAVYAGLRGYHDFPALDRSRDDRPTRVLSELTAGLDDRGSILLADLNWQIQNGLSYFSGRIRPEIAWARMPDVLLYAPALIADNQAIGRDVMLTERARATAAAAYGPLLSIAPDPRVVVRKLSEAVGDATPGTRYVLCVLRPASALALDRDDLALALQHLAGRAATVPDAGYFVVAGIVGQPPLVETTSERPFTRRLRVGGADVEIRLDAWLPADSIRRMGFGHVVVGHQHTLIVERGVSFAAFDDRGRAAFTAYASNIFAPQPRYVVRLQAAPQP